MRILLLKTFLSLPFGLHGTTFGKKTLQKFVVFNYKLDYIYSKFNQLLSSWNQDILQLNKLAKLLWVCWWNILLWHGTIKTLFITVTSEYTASSFKVCLYLMDSLVTLVAPMWVNWMIVPCHTSMGCSRIYRDQYWHNNQPLCIYGDPSLPLIVSSSSPIFQTKSYT